MMSTYQVIGLKYSLINEPKIAKYCFLFDKEYIEFLYV